MTDDGRWLGLGVAVLAVGASAFRTGSRQEIKKVDPEIVRRALDALWGLQRLYPVLHWQARGQTSFQDHLLYERLYNEVQKDLDRLGERAVGLFGSEVVSDREAALRAAVLVEAWQKGGNAVRKAITGATAAKEALTALSAAASDPGTKNLADELVDRQEEALYLLGQRAYVGAI